MFIAAVVTTARTGSNVNVHQQRNGYRRSVHSVISTSFPWLFIAFRIKHKHFTLTFKTLNNVTLPNFLVFFSIKPFLPFYPYFFYWIIITFLWFTMKPFPCYNLLFYLLLLPSSPANMIFSLQSLSKFCLSSLIHHIHPFPTLTKYLSLASPMHLVILVDSLSWITALD